MLFHFIKNAYKKPFTECFKWKTYKAINASSYNYIVLTILYIILYLLYYILYCTYYIIIYYIVLTILYIILYLLYYILYCTYTKPVLTSLAKDVDSNRLL